MSNNTNNNSQQKHSIPEEDEIDLIALAKTIWKGRKTILKTTLIFMGIGLFIAIFSEKEYTASTTMIPQTSEGIKIGGNLSGLAAMAGINLGSMGGDAGISPALYPQIVNSIPFQKELLNTQLTIKGQSEQISFAAYYKNVYSPSLFGFIKKYTFDLPNTISKVFKEEQKVPNYITKDEINTLLSISDEEKELIEILSDQLKLEVNDRDGYVALSIKMPEPIASAELTKKTQELLQKYIISFKIKKSLDQLEFIENRYIEKKKEFEDIQQNLAQFRDQNQNVYSALAKTKLERLKVEYDLTYGVYDELAKQLETQRIQVKEDTPVFTIIKPVVIPIEKSRPKRILIVSGFIFLGVFFGIFKITIEEVISKIQQRWRDNLK